MAVHTDPPVKSKCTSPEIRSSRGRKDVPILMLNDRWRVAPDFRLQWILQQRTGTRHWEGRTYPGHVSTLLRDIRRFKIVADPIALDAINTWPERFQDWLDGPDFRQHSRPTVIGITPWNKQSPQQSPRLPLLGLEIFAK